MLLDLIGQLKNTQFNHLKAFVLTLLAIPVLLIAHDRYKHFKYLRKCKKYGVAPINVENDGYLGLKRVCEKIRDSVNCTFMQGLERDVDKIGYKTFKATGCYGDVMVSSEPEIAKHILSTKHHEFTLGVRSKMLESFIGEGIFTQNGHSWKHSRSLMKPQFFRNRITDLGLFETNADNLVKIMKDSARRGEKLDIQHYFQCLTLDFSVEFLTGERLGCMLGNSRPLNGDNSNPSPSDLQNALNFCSEFVIRRSVALWFFWIINSVSFQRSIKTMENFFDVFVERARDVVGIESKATTTQKQQDENQKFVFINELAKDVPDNASLRHQCMNVLLAGRDTTSSLLSLCLYHVSRHPGVWEKLRTEVIETYTESKDGLNSENLRSCKYLKAVLNETMRMSAIIPFNVRCPNEDIILPRGGGPDGSEPTLLEGGTTVLLLTYNIHRDEAYWGPDAKEFNPERWMGENAPYTDPWAFLPFSGGPRICIGQQLALNEASYTMARIVQNFSQISAPQEEKGRELRFHSGIALFPDRGVPVYATE